MQCAVAKMSMDLMRKMWAAYENSLIPCTALGVHEPIKRSNIETFGKNAVVIGRSKNVGLPIFMLLHADGRNETGAID